jgi:hypothetical protein
VTAEDYHRTSLGCMTKNIIGFLKEKVFKPWLVANLFQQFLSVFNNAD